MSKRGGSSLKTALHSGERFVSGVFGNRSPSTLVCIPFAPEDATVCEGKLVETGRNGRVILLFSLLLSTQLLPYARRPV